MGRCLTGLSLLFVLCLTACGGGGGGSTVPSQPTPVKDDGTDTNAAPETVTIAGVVTFERVPHADAGGLAYPQSEPVPARGVQVRLLDSAGNALATGVTDATGTYSLQAPVATDVKVRVEAQMVRQSPTSLSFSVHDNTQSKSLYVLDGQLVNSGEQDSWRDLHAASGWNAQTQSYTDDARSAAPFAILDTVYEAVEPLFDVDPNLALPAMKIYWSSRNRAVPGDEAYGEIGTSFYSPSGVSIYLLGDADDDTDEYDRSVISHEFAHYLEDQISRSDSIGGSHSGASRLDMRVAFSEGWGNAFAGIATGDSIYRDSFGSAQQQVMAFSVAENTSNNHGWYSENSVQTILYTLFQEPLGLGPIYRTLVSDGYRQFDGATSIYPFATLLKRAGEVDAATIDGLLHQERIFGEDSHGTNESNTGSSSLALPLYHRLALGESREVCSDRQMGEYNGLDVRRFIRFKIDTSGSYRLSAERSSGIASADPDFVLWRQGALLHRADEDTAGLQVLETPLDAGDYWLEVYDYGNVDEEAGTGGLACFSVSLSNG
jgi:hypothetical protein